MEARDVIVVTDGDPIACLAVQAAAKELDLHVISASAGHPTKLTGAEIATQVFRAQSSPVIVFLDDRGDPNQGRGESALVELIQTPDIHVIGAIAVASEAKHASGVYVDASVTETGQVVSAPVDKFGHAISGTNRKLVGDTVDILEQLDIPVIIGLGDPGKQHHHDDSRDGAPLTKTALLEIMKRSSVNDQGT